MTPESWTSGIDAMGDMAWGTHVCQFYETCRDLLDIVVPYFRAGLARNERCLWVVSGPLTVDAARDALRREIEDADRRLSAGDIEVVSHTAFYLEGGAFDPHRVIARWRAAAAEALERGYAGLRVSANEAWLTEETRAAFMDYERAFQQALAGERLIATCTYPLTESTGAQVFDVARVHQSAMARRAGRWEVIEVLALAGARAAVQRRNEELERRVAERTQELAAANAALRESEELYRLLAEHTNDTILLHDADGRRSVYVSPSFERLLGRAPDGTFGHIHPEDQPAAREAWRRILAGEQTYVTVRHQHADGSWRWLETWGSPVEYRGASHVMAVSRDITERRALEEQLRQAQKMEAVGRLAGGVAHDFNNLLTVIAGYSTLTLNELRHDDPLRTNVEEIRAASDRAAALTRQLLAFSRRQILQPRELDLNAVIRNMERMLRRIIGEDIAFRSMLAPELGHIRADPGQIEQVVMNLVVNARDAMPQGGALTIATKHVDLGAGEAGELMLRGAGPHVALIVRDTGTGMDEATRARIFEPFFTTKEAGKGTGLGLSTVYGIVKQSGGGIRVDTEVGRGTTFTLYFLRLAAEVDDHAARVPLRASPKGSETVLVAEDDAMVRSLIRRVLRAHGYETLEAADGATAVGLCERHPGPIHLLLTDVVMPELGGRELVERLAQLRPEMRVLFMSGYTDDAIVQHGVPDSDIPFVQKPFTPDALARKVREVLDAAWEPIA